MLGQGFKRLRTSQPAKSQQTPDLLRLLSSIKPGIFFALNQLAALS